MLTTNGGQTLSLGVRPEGESGLTEIAIHTATDVVEERAANRDDTSETILVVDDNEQNRAFARLTLEDDGYQVEAASTGVDAIRAFERRPSDCVLLDVRMPGLDGFAVCSAIRQLKGGEDVPIVFLTALRDLDTFDAALRAGGDEFLNKPIRPTELVLRVQAALRFRRASVANRELAEQVRRQRDDLMRLQLQKERLMDFVIHDLKNPVGNIDLQAQVVEFDRSASANTRAAAASIRDEVRSLMRLLLNLLDISKSEEGRLSPIRAVVDVAQLVRATFESLAVRARARDVALASEIGSPAVNADPDLLRRLLENLLENALRHAPEHSVVRVKVADCGDATEIRVVDSGHGIPASLREAIFDRFVRVDAHEAGASRSGRGLGLAFCRLATEAHGGRIWVEDAEPGAEFCVRLPNEY